MEKLVTEASLSDSYIFRTMNRASHASTTIANAIKTGVKLDSSFIEEQLIQCKRSRLSPLLEKVLKAFETGEIILIYNKQVRVSTTLPFVVMSVNNKTSAYIFISDFSGISKDGLSLTIEMKKLYVLMEAAYVGKCFYTNPELFKRSIGLMKVCANIYSSMCMRIFNKKFSLSLDKTLYDKVSYCMARFELERMAELKNDSIIHSYASSTCLNPNKLILDNLQNDYINASITTIKDVIEMVSGLSTNLNGLTSRYFFEMWVSTFGTGASMSIDAFPYLYFVITDTLLGGFLTNGRIMNDIIKNTKGINLFYSEITKIV